MSTPLLIDVHTHTQFAAFREDQDAVIQRALDAGVWMINVGTQHDTSAAASETAHRYPEGVWATAGLHPIHTEKSYHDEKELGIPQHSQVYKDVGGTGFVSRGEGFAYEYYKKLAIDLKVVAVGECGLDYYRLGEETREKQKVAFVQQIELAAEVKKPLMIHCRQAFSDLISILQDPNSKLQILAGVIHFFTGTVDDARKLLDLGFYFSFGGVITFTHDYDDVVKYIPLQRLLLETDAPYVAPVPYRGKRNEPSYIAEIAKRLGELKGAASDRIAEETTVNARTLFGI